MHFTGARKPTDEEIKAFESRVGFPLSATFVDFYQRYAGGVPSKHIVENRYIRLIYPINDPNNDPLDPVKVGVNLEKGLILFAHEGGGQDVFYDLFSDEILGLHEMSFDSRSPIMGRLDLELIARNVWEFVDKLDESDE